MEKSDPFSIFKSYRTTFKEQEMERAYETTQKLMIKPFKTFKSLIYIVLFLAIINSIFLILKYLGKRSNSKINSIIWISAQLLIVLTTKILLILDLKYPQSHNKIGSIFLLIIFSIINEVSLIVNPPIIAFV